MCMINTVPTLGLLIMSGLIGQSSVFPPVFQSTASRYINSGQVWSGQRWDWPMKKSGIRDYATGCPPHNFTFMQPFCISNWGHWFQCSSSWDSQPVCMNMRHDDQGLPPAPSLLRASDQLWPFLSEGQTSSTSA